MQSFQHACQQVHNHDRHDYLLNLDCTSFIDCIDYIASSINFLQMVLSRVPKQALRKSISFSIMQALAAMLTAGGAPELIFLDLRGNALTDAGTQTMVSHLIHCV